MTAVRERATTVVPRGRIVAFFVLVAACWGTLLAAMPQATGDPVLITTSPGSTEVVKSPGHVLLTFDRPVPAGLATVRILDPDGSQVVHERPVHPAGRDDTISVPMPKERHEGTYAVAWTLPSSGLQPISGSFTFDVSYRIDPEGVPDIETTHDPVLAAVHLTARAAAVVALVLLTGLAVFVAWNGTTRRARRWVKATWWVSAGATVVALLSFGPYAAWAPLRDAFDPRLLSGALASDAGGALLARLYVLVPATLGLAQLMTSPPAATAGERRLRVAAVLGCATALLATWPLAGPPLVLAADVAVLALVAVPVGWLVLSRRWAAVVLLAATAAGVVLLPGGHVPGQPPAALRNQVAPTRLAYDTGKPGGQGAVDLVLIPTATRLDAHVSVLNDDVSVTAVLTAAGRTVPLPLHHAGTGHWAGSAAVPERGRWELALTLRAADGSTQTIPQPIDVR
ncbi:MULTISPECIES: copper resistance CopC family protein [Amycolatopsis]|uniref:CopC domain-containing protein n=1 Tax=Amycolatopsis dongchuanensis TaxID=1070866 RepID=A0ABP9R936_9PSEU